MAKSTVKTSKYVFYAVVLHMILLSAILFSWHSAEKLPNPPVTSIKATIYQAPVSNPTKNTPITKTVIEPEKITPKLKPKIEPIAPKIKETIKTPPKKEVVKKEAKKELVTKKIEEQPNKNKTKPKPALVEKDLPKIAAEDLKIANEPQSNLPTSEEEQAQLLAQLLADSKNYNASDLPENIKQSAINGEQINNETTAKFDALIGQLVSEQWVIPASAKRGMQVEINIEIEASGIISSAVVVNSSGNFALDNSAIAAIKAVAIIYEVQDMSFAEFQLIRNRTLVFSPSL